LKAAKKLLVGVISNYQDGHGTEAVPFLVEILEMKRVQNSVIPAGDQASEDQAEPGLDLHRAADPQAAPSVEEMSVAERKPMAYKPETGTPLLECPHNIPIHTPEGKRLMFAAGNPADLVIDPDHKDERGRPYIVIAVRYWLIYPDEFIDPDSNELTFGCRTVLVTSSGETFKTSSGHAPSRLAAACEMFSPEEWAAGIKIRITERKSRNPKRQSPYHDIRLED